MNYAKEDYEARLVPIWKRMKPKYVPDVKIEKSKEVIKPGQDEQNEQITEDAATSKIIPDVELQKENDDLKKQNKSLHEEIQKLKEQKTLLAKVNQRYALQEKQNDHKYVTESDKNLDYFRSECFNLTQALDREKKEKEEIKINFEKEKNRCDKLLKAKTGVLMKLAELDEQTTKYHNEALDREKKEKEEMKQNFEKEKKQIESQLSQEQIRNDRLQKEKTDALLKLSHLNRQVTNYQNEILELKKLNTQYQESNYTHIFEKKQIESQLSQEQYRCERLLKDKEDALMKLTEMDKQNTKYHEMKINFEKEKNHCDRLVKEKTDDKMKLAELDKQVTKYHNEILELKKIISQYQEENWFKRQYNKHKNPAKDVQRKAHNVNPEVAMGAQNVNPGPKPGPKPYLQKKNKVCVASSNKKYMAAVAQNVEKMLHPFFPPGDLVIFQKKITSSINDGFYEGATFVVLVATASQRMLLISNKEDSQVGKAYQQAEKEGASVFLVVAGHSDSDGLPDTVPYANSLTRVFSLQPKVRMLAEQRKLISVAYTYNPSELKFNTEQSKLIGEWLQ